MIWIVVVSCGEKWTDNPVMWDYEIEDETTTKKSQRKRPRRNEETREFQHHEDLSHEKQKRQP